MYLYIPKKSKEIYKEIIAHRGYHDIWPENSILAFKKALMKNMAIEVDIRKTVDNEIICIHDRYLKRLLGIKGRVSKKTYSEIKNEYILNSNEKVPTLKEVLDLINGKITILIEVKDFMDYMYEKKLIEIMNGYNGKFYFHTKNILTYKKLQKIYETKVFWILNPFRKRFNFIKGGYYKRAEFIVK